MKLGEFRSHMKKSIKYKISKALSCNCELNKQALCIKRSWDEVEALLNKGCKCDKKCNCDSHKHKW